MGIGGHMLGERKLRKLRALTHLPLDRAFIRNGACHATIWRSDRDLDCEHYSVDLTDGTYQRVNEGDADWIGHWASCYADSPVRKPVATA